MKKIHLISLPIIVACLSGCSFVDVLLPDTSDTSDINTSTQIGDVADKDFLVNPKLESGFDIEPVKGDDTRYVAHKYSDVADIITKTIIEHKDSVLINFQFANNLTIAEIDERYCEINLHASVYTFGEITPSQGDDVRVYINYNNHEYTSGGIGRPVYQIASKFLKETSKSPRVRDVLNANQQIRLKNQTKRKANFNNFDIETRKYCEEIKVHNSEELWWVVSRGYRPTFPLKNSKAEAIYNAAKKVLRKYVNDEMNDFEKMRAIYEWIVSQNSYDNPAADDPTDDDSFIENTAYYLEGVFQYRSAVCDSFSKTMALLAGIEGIDVIRSFGYTDEEGHAWNYGSPDHDGTYYLICSTWGQLVAKDAKKENIGMCDYRAFLAGHDYFEKQGKVKFNEYIFEDRTKSNVKYSPSVWSLDKMPQNNEYDCQIDSQGEMKYVIEQAVNACNKQTFSIQLQRGKNLESNGTLDRWVDKALKELNYSGTYKFFPCRESNSPLIDVTPYYLQKT